MYLEDYEINVGHIKHKVVHCKGDGQCVCSRCKTPSWTSWFYKISKEDKDVLCIDCLCEFFIQQRIRNGINELVERFVSGCILNSKNETFTKKEILKFLDDAIFETKILIN